MITPDNIKRAKVSDLAEQGFSFIVLIPTLIENSSSKESVPTKISAIQLSKAVTHANRQDLILADLKYGRNGRKTAIVKSVPIF